MLCPFCKKRGGQRFAEEAPFDKWRCKHCHEEYLAFSGYPVHPEALVALAEGQVRCPVCGNNDTSRITDAPPLGLARAFQCASCSAIFPVLPLRDTDDVDTTLELVPIHPQAMIETVTGVELLPSFFAISERLREYIEQTGFTLVRTEDKVDLNTQLREFTFYSVPDEWVAQRPCQAEAVQCSLSFAWHAGQAQFAGVEAQSVDTPIPIAISLGLVVNPEWVPKSLPAYLALVQGLSDILIDMNLAATTSVDAQLVVEPLTQEASIGHLSCVRRYAIDLRSPEQWAGLIFEMMKQKELIARTWQLIATETKREQD